MLYPGVGGEGRGRGWGEGREGGEELGGERKEGRAWG